MSETVTDDMIIDCLHHDGAEDGIILLLSQYEDEVENAYTIYNRWKRLRSLMMRDDRFVNRQYEDMVQELMRISKVLDPTYFDLQLLQNLLLSSQVDRHNIQQRTRKETFKSVEVYNQFKKLKPFINVFYQFKLPEEIVNANFAKVHEYNLQKQKHERSRSNIFEISRGKLLAWKQIATEAVNKGDYYTKKNIGYVIAAIQLLSGRRLIEILEKMRIVGMGPTRYSAEVVNLAKEKATIDNFANPTPLVIPLLCDYDLFVSTVTRLRELEPNSGAVRSYVITKTSIAAREMFGEALDHTIKRNVYCELCWMEKHVHQCYTNYSKKAFCGTILGHSLGSFDNTDQYTSITVV